MAEAELHRRRTTFDEVAEQYERARPTYPEALLTDLAGLAGLSRGAHLLEIGCGTGQATLALAERGFRLTCVELAERLAAAARRNLRSFPAVEVVNAPFETWDPGSVRFDAVLAFTSFHWIDPELRYAKSARLLHAGGALTVVATKHVLGTAATRSSSTCRRTTTRSSRATTTARRDDRLAFFLRRLRGEEASRVD